MDSSFSHHRYEIFHEKCLHLDFEVTLKFFLYKSLDCSGITNPLHQKSWYTSSLLSTNKCGIFRRTLPFFSQTHFKLYQHFKVFFISEDNFSPINWKFKVKFISLIMSEYSKNITCETNRNKFYKCNFLLVTDLYFSISWIIKYMGFCQFEFQNIHQFQKMPQLHMRRQFFYTSIKTFVS